MKRELKKNVKVFLFTGLQGVELPFSGSFKPVLSFMKSVFSSFQIFTLIKHKMKHIQDEKRNATGKFVFEKGLTLVFVNIFQSLKMNFHRPIKSSFFRVLIVLLSHLNLIELKSLL